MTDLTQRARDVAGRLQLAESYMRCANRASLHADAAEEAAAIISELVERIEGLENKPRDGSSDWTNPMTNEPEPNTRAGEALKPCLNCGCATVETLSFTSNRKADRAMCPKCGIQGPISSWNTRHLPQPSELVEGYDPCPTCRQYSHSIGCDVVAAAFNHFQSMIAHPVRGHPMGDAFDEQTRDAAQVLMAQLAKLQADGDKLAGYVRHNGACSRWNLSGDCTCGLTQALTEWKDRA